MLVLAEHDFTYRLYVHMQLVGREQDMEAGAGWVRSSMCVKIALITNRHIQQKLPKQSTIPMLKLREIGFFNQLNPRLFF